MSKAFTKETDGDEDDEVSLPPLAKGAKNYITPAGYARLRAELLDLIDNERPKVVEAVHWAASNGDRSENGDYLYGKKRLREIDRRIRFLTKRLEIAEVVDPSCRIPDDCIDSKRYPLFIARAVLKELIESLQSIQGVKPC